MVRVILLVLLLCGSVQAAVPLAAWEYQDEMTDSAYDVFGPRAPVAALAAQIHQESGWKCSAISWAGAKGCAQFMKATADDMAKRYPEFCAPADPSDPEWDFTCRDLYMQSLLRSNQNANDECSQWAFALKGYNGGQRWVSRDRKLAAQGSADSGNWLAVQPFNAGRKPSAFKENTEYPIRIFKRMYEYESWGRVLPCPRTL